MKQNKKTKQKQKTSQVLGAHACSPDYLGGRDQEDCGVRQAWAKK
jgi:hypothetical protein